MVAGLAAPNPSGIPGFNEAYVKAGGVGAVNANPLRSWYNVVIDAPTAAGAVQLPPAAGTAMQVTVVNNSGKFPGTAANAVTVFGGLNIDGSQDTIANATGVQGTAGVSVPANAVGLFYVLTGQSGFTNEPMAGSWQFKILA